VRLSEIVTPEQVTAVAPEGIVTLATSISAPDVPMEKGSRSTLSLSRKAPNPTVPEVGVGESAIALLVAVAREPAITAGANEVGEKLSVAKVPPALFFRMKLAAGTLEPRSSRARIALRAARFIPSSTFILKLQVKRNKEWRLSLRRVGGIAE
jgi:hypothetical protein